MKDSKVAYDITIAGSVTIDGVNCIDAKYEAENGYVAKMRNIAAENSKYSNIVWMDDDMILAPYFLANLMKYSAANPWDILGVKILQPDGGRCWDRATINPHTMISYDAVEYPGRLYQTSGLVIMRASVWDIHKWDDTIDWYGKKSGGYPEDVEYSFRLQDNGYTLMFDRENTVWHYDEGYKQVGMSCIRKSDFGIEDECIYNDEFKTILEDLI
tara:strand:+ start:378 stop:1019 length:642 start_codon:yes stop_codon:yes gene_type:complete